jgi:hypothetical protein
MTGLWAGHYVLRAYSTWIISEVLHRGQSLYDGGLDTSAGVDVDGIVVRVRNDPGRVIGRVVNVAADAQAGVLVFPVMAQGWRNYGWTPPRIQVVQTQSEGRFEIGRIPAGEYFVVALDSSEQNAWLDGDFLAAASVVGERIRVEWGRTAQASVSTRKIRK